MIRATPTRLSSTPSGRTLGKRLISTFIPDTYASMKNRGIHRGVRRIRRHLDQYLEMENIYIFKFDLRKIL